MDTVGSSSQEVMVSEPVRQRDLDMMLAIVSRVERAVEDHRREVAEYRKATSERLEAIQRDLVDIRLWKAWLIGIGGGVSLVSTVIWDWLKTHWK